MIWLKGFFLAWLLFLAFWVGVYSEPPYTFVVDYGEDIADLDIFIVVPTILFVLGAILLGLGAALAWLWRKHKSSALKGQDNAGP